ncbi:transcriptional regulator GcvA [Mesorhizobium sp. NBSH29]|uniref:transcriptional regulator GcvA n=1 Tax=Mesorhizobium sp. NBSH29 TaxID=2654249 RepID=UPI00189675E5|nr:transcriptional regulator GcvA [Mesorhizobium sp. NBSH29]QPC85979.1 transcriptional regulator GcvA [Mesorhizobium sp. NBSH29]
MSFHIPGTRALRAFEAAGRNLSFTRAANELRVTPAAISHQIKEFEDQLGVALFARTSRTMQMTPAGEIIFAATTEALSVLTRAASRARRTRGGMRLRITASASIAAKWLVPRIDEFMERWPEIDVRMDISTNVREFDRDDVDVAIRWGDGNYDGMRSDRLFDNTIFPVCSPTLLARRPLNEPADLLHHMLIHVAWSGQGVTWPDWRMWLLAAGIRDFDDGPGLHFTDSGPAIQAAIDGQGVVLGDSSLVADDLAAGHLVQPFELSIKGPAQFAYRVVSPVETAGDPLVSAFREWVLEEAAKTLTVATPPSSSFRRPSRR